MQAGRGGERAEEREKMAVSVSILAILISLHLIAFVLAVGAEQRRSTAQVDEEQYDERTYCVYGSDASTAYGLAAFGLLLTSQTILNAVTKCLCFGKGLRGGCYPTFVVVFFVFSWTAFLGAESCLLVGSVRNAYHTKYRGVFGGQDMPCVTLRKGVFAAAASLTLLSMAGSILYYWTYRKARMVGWEKHQNEGLGMTTSEFTHQQQP